MLRAVNIEWDVSEYDDDMECLPSEVDIPKEIGTELEYIIDYLSNEYGYCVYSCSIDVISDNNIEQYELKEMIDATEVKDIVKIQNMIDELLKCSNVLGRIELFYELLQLKSDLKNTIDNK